MGEPATESRDALRVIITELLALFGSQQAWRPFTVLQTAQLTTWKDSLAVIRLPGEWGRLCHKVATLVDFLSMAQCVTLNTLQTAGDVRRELAILSEEPLV